MQGGSVSSATSQGQACIEVANEFSSSDSPSYSSSSFQDSAEHPEGMSGAGAPSGRPYIPPLKLTERGQPVIVYYPSPTSTSAFVAIASEPAHHQPTPAALTVANVIKFIRQSQRAGPGLGLGLSLERYHHEHRCRNLYVTEMSSIPHSGGNINRSGYDSPTSGSDTSASEGARPHKNNCEAAMDEDTWKAVVGSRIRVWLSLVTESRKHERMADEDLEPSTSSFKGVAQIANVDSDGVATTPLYPPQEQHWQQACYCRSTSSSQSADTTLTQEVPHGPLGTAGVVYGRSVGGLAVGGSSQGDCEGSSPADTNRRCNDCFAGRPVTAPYFRASHTPAPLSQETVTRTPNGEGSVEERANNGDERPAAPSQNSHRVDVGCSARGNTSAQGNNVHNATPLFPQPSDHIATVTVALPPRAAKALPTHEPRDFDPQRDPLMRSTVASLNSRVIVHPSATTLTSVTPTATSTLPMTSTVTSGVTQAQCLANIRSASGYLVPLVPTPTQHQLFNHQRSNTSVQPCGVSQGVALPTTAVPCTTDASNDAEDAPPIRAVASRATGYPSEGVLPARDGSVRNLSAFVRPPPPSDGLPSGSLTSTLNNRPASTPVSVCVGDTGSNLCTPGGAAAGFAAPEHPRGLSSQCNSDLEYSGGAFGPSNSSINNSGMGQARGTRGDGSTYGIRGVPEIAAGRPWRESLTADSQVTYTTMQLSHPPAPPSVAPTASGTMASRRSVPTSTTNDPADQPTVPPAPISRCVTRPLSTSNVPRRHPQRQETKWATGGLNDYCLPSSISPVPPAIQGVNICSHSANHASRPNTVSNTFNNSVSFGGSVDTAWQASSGSIPNNNSSVLMASRGHRSVTQTPMVDRHECSGSHTSNINSGTQAECDIYLSKIFLATQPQQQGLSRPPSSDRFLVPQSNTSGLMTLPVYHQACVSGDAVFPPGISATPSSPVTTWTKHGRTYSAVGSSTVSGTLVDSYRGEQQAPLQHFPRPPQARGQSTTAPHNTEGRRNSSLGNTSGFSSIAVQRPQLCANLTSTANLPVPPLERTGYLNDSANAAGPPGEAFYPQSQAPGL